MEKEKVLKAIQGLIDQAIEETRDEDGTPTSEYDEGVIGGLTQAYDWISTM